MEALKVKIAERLAAFLEQDRIERANPALLGCGYYVATADGSSTVRLDEGTARLVYATPGFVGSSRFTRSDADKVRASLGNEPWGPLVVVHRNELLARSIATCRESLAELESFIAQG